MRRLTLLTILTIAITVPLQASRSKHQSYISYDDGGTIVRQGEDGREVDARVNLPVFPGDEVITNRRGRVEIRLSDGNVLGLDRSTAIRFHSMLDNYEGESSQTVVEVLYGHVIVNRPDDEREHLRLDSKNASYVAIDEAIYAIDTDSDGRDRITVFDGSIEVRTPERTTRLRSGEGANVDDNGLYGLVSEDRYSADDFERWFLRRAERYNERNSRYLDRSLAHYDDDLEAHGSWIHVSSYGGYAWRPRVGAGWRPYYYGQWVRSRSGCLTWVSYEPWGWAPYHYGRWAHDPMYGWVWLPGLGYSPAWVYWMYGPSYIGWAPMGWYDCYRPYYNWAYRPYTTRADFGFGFYGRVRVHELDLRPWTFVDSNTIVSNRVDRAALTTDAIRERFQRTGDGGLATVAGGANRFTREELRDPAAAINRRGLVGGTGTGPGSPAGGGDITPFFRRDPELTSSVRERITRGREAGGAAPSAPSGRTGGSGTVSGGLAPIGGGNIAPIGGGNIAPIGGGNVAPIGGGNVAPTTRGEGGRVNRGGDWRSQPSAPSTPSTPSTTDRIGGRVSRGGDTPAPSVTPREGAPSTDWRDRVSKDRIEKPAEKPATAAPSTGDSSWRDRVGRGNEGRSSSTAPREKTRDSGSSDAPPPRRVIDRIGGARVSPDRGGSSSGGGMRSSPPPRQSSPPPPPPSSSKGSDGGGGKGGGGGEGKVKKD